MCYHKFIQGDALRIHITMGPGFYCDPINSNNLNTIGFSGFVDYHIVLARL